MVHPVDVFIVGNFPKHNVYCLLLNPHRYHKAEGGYIPRAENFRMVDIGINA